MKVDGLGVIMAIILLPIILVVTYYIQLQVDTIAKENSYNTKLLNATYDAMSAFEMNTANEELSSVADSMRSIILASNNTFFNTLATNLGMSNASQENLRPYIPAILYTMYDGYYIYSPAETAVVGEKTEEKDGLITTKGYLSVGGIGVKAEDNKIYSYYSSATTITDKPYDENDPTSVYGAILYKDKNNDGKYTTDKNNAVTETDYILKPYTQYSARYVNDIKKIDITINYTLDNYINIEGTIGEVYYTKSGYLIDKNLVSSFDIGNGDVNSTEFSKYNEKDLQDTILGVKSDKQGLTQSKAQAASVTVNGRTISVDGNLLGESTISEAEEAQKKGQLNNPQIYEVQKYNAIAYYASSAVFSNWVYNNLGDLQYGNIKEDNLKIENSNIKLSSDLHDYYYIFNGNTTKIFDGDPEDVKSNFNTHRIEVIKNSIKYNLNQSISAYCKKKGSNDYSLPVLTDTEWDNILSKISIVSFMQGWDCGLDIYNNYEIAYSTNNELTVIPSEIYYVTKGEFNNETGEFHRIDCPSLKNSNDYIAIKSNEIKYDKLADSTGRYNYDHKNLACYTCINNNNYESRFWDKATSYSYYERIKNIKDDGTAGNSNNDKIPAGYIGLGAMRQSTYKTNALEVSEGYKSEYKHVQLSGSNNILNIPNNLKRVELTFSGAFYMTPNGKSSVEVKINDEDNLKYTIPLSITNTIVINNPPTGNSIPISVDGEGRVWLENIKYIYK